MNFTFRMVPPWKSGWYCELWRASSISGAELESKSWEYKGTPQSPPQEISLKKGLIRWFFGGLVILLYDQQIPRGRMALGGESRGQSEVTEQWKQDLVRVCPKNVTFFFWGGGCYIYIYLWLYLYIYTYRERERDILHSAKKRPVFRRNIAVSC